MYKCYLLSLLVIIMACSDEPDMDIPQPSPKICVAGFISPDSIMVHLYKNRYILADSSEKFEITDTTAIIKIYENGSIFSTLNPKKINDYVYFTTSKKPAEGGSYTIEVTVEGFPPVTSSTFIPKAVPIISIDTFVYNKEGYPYVMCNVHFQDPPQTEDFYFLEARAKLPGVYYSSSIGIDSNDPVVEEKVNFGGNQLIFSDKEIQGREYGLSVSIAGYFFNWSNVQIVLCSVSKDFYLHFKSYVHYDKAKKDEFSEPVLIYTNIKNGLGIFAGYSTSIKSYKGDSIH